MNKILWLILFIILFDLLFVAFLWLRAYRKEKKLEEIRNKIK